MSDHDLFLKFKADTEEFAPKYLKATFMDRDEQRIKFDDSEQYWRDFVNKWWHHHSLEFEPLVLTQAQQDRLDEINSAGLTAEHLFEASEYVQHGVVYPETQTPFLTELKDTPEAQVALVEYIRKQKRADLARVRYNKEVGGITTPQGVDVLTSREAQAQLNSTYSSLKDDLVTEADWKAPTGWVTVTFDEIAPIAKFSATHVQVCFSAERHVDEGIISTTDDLEELQALQVEDFFEQEYQTLMAQKLEG